MESDTLEMCPQLTAFQAVFFAVCSMPYALNMTLTESLAKKSLFVLHAPVTFWERKLADVLVRGGLPLSDPETILIDLSNCSTRMAGICVPML